jgi:hypothetical protein
MGVPGGGVIFTAAAPTRSSAAAAGSEHEMATDINRYFMRVLLEEHLRADRGRLAILRPGHDLPADTPAARLR